MIAMVTPRGHTVEPTFLEDSCKTVDYLPMNQELTLRYLSLSHKTNWVHSVCGQSESQADSPVTSPDHIRKRGPGLVSAPTELQGVRPDRTPTRVSAPCYSVYLVRRLRLRLRAVTDGRL